MYITCTVFQIPVITTLSPLTRACKMVALDAVGDHVTTCTSNSGTKKKTFHVFCSFYLWSPPLWSCANCILTDSSGHRTHRFFTASGVDLARHNQDMFHFHRTAFYSHLKSVDDTILVKVTGMCVNLDIDDAPVASHSYTPSHKPLVSHQLTSP